MVIFSAPLKSKVGKKIKNRCRAWIFQSLAYTIGAQPDLIAQLDAFRKKRNVSDYQRAGAVSPQEAREIFTCAKSLREQVTSWLKTNHPDLT